MVSSLTKDEKNNNKVKVRIWVRVRVRAWYLSSCRISSSIWRGPFPFVSVSDVQHFMYKITTPDKAGDKQDKTNKAGRTKGEKWL